MKWRRHWGGSSTGPWAHRNNDWLRWELKRQIARTKERKAKSSNELLVSTLSRSHSIPTGTLDLPLGSIFEWKNMSGEKRTAVGLSFYGTVAQCFWGCQEVTQIGGLFEGGQLCYNLPFLICFNFSWTSSSMVFYNLLLYSLVFLKKLYLHF